ncbi:MAG: hypothetical protein EP311_00535 [Cytophagales bacterium]|uniref:Fibronectin type-III domain-containing protein n=1 Tax=Algoriphagus taiwanensis TaxID=1445656 RepID=A0ABQ6PWT9_9BACT|nr:MAG: hypothetical protein EP311_00535 [Cytophagales bacterium]GMQ32253.1 hypothetical protein Ataiwa_05250 [Algoriphagus taiwanensis]
MNKFNLVLVIFLSLISFSCEEEKFDVEKFGSISGIVVDGNDYTALSGVQITTTPPSTAILTDENGSFQLEKVQEGDVIITARKEDYLTGTVSIAVFENENTNLTFFLSKDENDVGSVVLFDPVPGNGAVNQGLDLTLGWNVDQSQPDVLLTYTVFLFESNSTDQEIVGQNLTTTEVIVADLKPNTTYYWYVLAKFENRNVANSPTWTFRTGSGS